MNVISTIHWTIAGSDLYDQRGGYKLLYYARHHVVQTQVLILRESDLHTNVRLSD